jgi:pimeloyl-ACP methyl ester carboxylesterase
VPSFAARHRTIVFDNRGAGRSDKPAGPYTIQLLADDAVHMLDTVGAKRAHVIGISMGGMIAQDLVLRYPDRVGALVLACTFARPDETTRRTQGSGLGMMKGGDFDPRQIFKFMMSLVLSPEFIEREKPWLRGLLEKAQSYGFSVEAFLAQVSAIMNHDAAARLKEVRSPTLVMTGTNDILVPPHHSDELAQLIPGAKLLKMEGGTHGFNVERKDEFNQSVLDFLAQHPL